MRLIALLAVLASCTGSNMMQSQAMTNTSPSDPKLSRLMQVLAEARKQSDGYLSGDALPARKDIAAIVDEDPRQWWQSLTPAQAFLLFEASPETAARAPIEARLAAYCAGVESVSAEWWGTPDGPETALSRRVIALGKPIAKCLARLFDSDRRISYLDGEARLEAKENQWTVADLAASLAARAIGEAYNATASLAERAARRAALRPILE